VQLPLFPLSQVVLFPRTQVPLHVFEARYRQMTEAALSGDRRIGMVAIRPEHVDAIAGDPPLYPVGCAGEITRFERLGDGRYHLLLEGTQRFRIQGEPPRSPPRLYRIAEVELLEDPLPPEQTNRVAALRYRALEFLEDLLQRVQGDARADAEHLASHLAQLDDPTFVDALCQSLSFSTPERQGLSQKNVEFLRMISKNLGNRRS
jgi:Lon protease-like protein